MITVLIPTIGRDTLMRAVDSVLAQTVRCEVHVLHDKERIGPGPMLNRMLPFVHTPWVAGLADDDSFEPHFAKLVTQQPQDVDMLVFQMRYPDGRVLPWTTNPDELTFGGVGASYVTKTEMARKVGWIDRPYPEPEDWPMICAVREIGKIVVVPEVVYRIRH